LEELGFQPRNIESLFSFRLKGQNIHPYLTTSRYVFRVFAELDGGLIQPDIHSFDRGGSYWRNLEKVKDLSRAGLIRVDWNYAFNNILKRGKI
jgi:hypothetical protein